MIKELDVGGQSLTYDKKGTGSKHIIFFHGFGQDHRAFGSWVTDESTYTYILLDLPFHGGSDFNESPIDHAFWYQIVLALLREEDIENFTLVAFSLGGKLALSTLMTLGDKIDRLVLIAPDGVYVSPWYRLSTNRFFKPIFRYLMTHDHMLRLIVSIVENLHITKSSVVKFARRELHDKSNRIRVYKSWVFLKPLGFSGDEVRSLLANRDLRITLILGEWDQVIPAKHLIPAIGELVDDLYILAFKHDHLQRYSNIVDHVKPLP